MRTSGWIDRVIAEHERPLVQYAAHLLRDAERARDVVQEVFVQLCLQDHQGLDGHLGQWLYTVCRNKALDVLRKESRMKPLLMEKASGSLAGDESAASTLEQDEEYSSVLRALGSLPPNQQEVVRLKFQQDLSYKQIAAVTGLSIGNVGYLLHTALNTLRRNLLKEGGLEP